MDLPFEGNNTVILFRFCISILGSSIDYVCSGSVFYRNHSKYVADFLGFHKRSSALVKTVSIVESFVEFNWSD